jgi:hypothetical protein
VNVVPVTALLIFLHNNHLESDKMKLFRSKSKETHTNDRPLGRYLAIT